ncbi:V-set and immunoglobulin domain-containing protein 10-like [Diretmus argenteus]
MTTWLERGGGGVRGERGLRVVLLALTLSVSLHGAHCDLELSPAGPTLFNATVGSTVTLAVSFSGASAPVVRWFMGTLPVVTWTIGSDTEPDIPSNHRAVLKVEPNGSLTFENVRLGYSNNYTMEITKSGVGTASTSFILRVYEYIQNVTVSPESDYATEGMDRFTLQYSTLQGVAEQRTWFFNGVRITGDSHYSVEQKSLVINRPNRNDTGQYTLVLTNPFSDVTTLTNVTVLYGPDEPVVETSPAQSFYVSGDSLSLSCRAEGLPQPSADWVFGGQTLSGSHEGVLNLTDVQTGQGGVYTCVLLNPKTGARRQKNTTVHVYERPLGDPRCSVQAVNDGYLQYHCRWPGGAPLAQLSFPALSNTTSGAGDLSLTMTASADLNGKPVVCVADHPLKPNTCKITARRPVEFLPSIRTTVNSEGKIVVTIRCISDASPKAVVSWSKGSELVTNGTKYQISTDTTQLRIRDFNVSSFLLDNCTCTCRNPLGSQRRATQLQAPTISDSSLFPNQDGTVITLTWEVPPTSVITGFDIQMKGPDLLEDGRNSSRIKRASQEFRSIQLKPGSARSADVLALDPKATYRFRVIPNAGRTQGASSAVHRIGPGEGLSGPAIAGIAAGIPCSLLFLLLLIFLCVYCCKRKRRQTKYPAPRAVEQRIGVVATPPDIPPHKLLTGGLKSPPDYNRLHQAPSERSLSLPTFVPSPPVRFATTV